MLETENTFKEHGPQPNWEGKQASGVCGSMFGVQIPPHVLILFQQVSNVVTNT